MEELNDNDKSLTQQLNQMNTRYKTIDNLMAIKQIILKNTQYDLKKLKMYKAYYSISLKETVEEVYFKIVMGLLVSVALFLLKSELSQKVDLNYSNAVFIGLIFIFTILAIVGVIMENKKRTSLIVEILEVCIDEIEDEEKEIGKNS